MKGRVRPTAPLLLLLTTGGVDFGGALYEQHRLTAAARAGAQVAMLSGATIPDDGAIGAAACNDAGAGSYSAGACGSLTVTSAASGSGPYYVSVSVSETYTTLIDYGGGPSIPITGLAIFRVQ